MPLTVTTKVDGLKRAVCRRCYGSIDRKGNGGPKRAKAVLQGRDGGPTASPAPGATRKKSPKQ